MIPTNIPAYTLPTGNRRVLLTRRPHGVPQSADFTLDMVAVPEPGPGQFLVRNIYLSVDPAQRGWASDEANYATPVPLGTPMRALAIGVVVRSLEPSVGEGAFLYGWFGWQDYAVVDVGAVVSHATEAVPLSAHAGLLGMNGLTAYLALTQLGRPVPGDTLLVSTAAGSVGGFVGQIGKLLGCRTLGLTGDDAKVAICRGRFGYDEAANYRTANVEALLAEWAVAGINVYFDNTGGSILDAALRQMAVGGRIVQCGTAANQVWVPAPTGPRNEREVMTRRLVWSGFVVFDHVARFAEAARQLASWYRAGQLVYEEDISDGIAAAPSAIASLYAGENRGKKLIDISSS
jgi:NADPH-dependent curcumin reductase CurA